MGHDAAQQSAPVWPQPQSVAAPVYLEIVTPENAGLYQRLGFAVIEEWDVPRGGPHFWSMGWQQEAAPNYVFDTDAFRVEP